MARMLLPLFDQFPEEAAIIGRLIAGYGEIEFGLALCAGAVIGAHSGDEFATTGLTVARGEAGPSSGYSLCTEIGDLRGSGHDDAKAITRVTGDQPAMSAPGACGQSARRGGDSLRAV